jgi:predicted transcriptional regulator
MPTATTGRYPLPGTNAERVLNFIIDNPETTTNKIIEKLAMNPTVARKCLKSLIEHSKIKDAPDENQHHHYTALGRVL